VIEDGGVSLLIPSIALFASAKRFLDGFNNDVPVASPSWNGLWTSVSAVVTRVGQGASKPVQTLQLIFPNVLFYMLDCFCVDHRLLQSILSETVPLNNR
jgi:hypothetical protein